MSLRHAPTAKKLQNNNYTLKFHIKFFIAINFCYICTRNSFCEGRLLHFVCKFTELLN